MTIVMGLDQHRAQITAEWIDTATGELSRNQGNHDDQNRQPVRNLLGRQPRPPLGGFVMRRLLTIVALALIAFGTAAATSTADAHASSYKRCAGPHERLDPRRLLRVARRLLRPRPA